MINHGLNVGALFFICEILHHRYGTTKFKDLQGLGCKLKILSGITVFYVMCSVGLPGLNGFVGEVMCLFGMFETKNPSVSGKIIASICSLGMVFGAWYLISMVMKVFFGKLSEPVFKKKILFLTLLSLKSYSYFLWHYFVFFLVFILNP